MMMLSLLGQAASAGMDPAMVGTMIGGMLATLIGGGFLGKKISDSAKVRIENQPLEVMLRKEYITRAEFNDFRGEVKSDVKEMRGLFDKALTLIQERDEKLTEKIESVATGAYEGRRRLHDKVNEHDKMISRIDARTDVSKSIGKLGAAVMTLAREKKQEG